MAVPPGQRMLCTQPPHFSNRQLRLARSCLQTQQRSLHGTGQLYPHPWRVPQNPGPLLTLCSYWSCLCPDPPSVPYL